MSLKRCVCSAALISMFCIAGIPGRAQERPAEATPDVPALNAFHKVIFRIWHEAWPAKDTAMLRQLLPEVEKGISEVASAKLPGILRDKQAAWDEGIKRLQKVGSEYRAAAVARDDPGLMAAAERLHSRFEALVRTIRPALQELDEFHAVLYMLYHYYLPEYDIQRVRSSAVELKKKMAVLNNAALPGRLKQKEAEFQAARAKLSASVDALSVIVKTDDEQKIRNAVDVLHSDYQALEKIF